MKYPKIAAVLRIADRRILPLNNVEGKQIANLCADHEKALDDLAEKNRLLREGGEMLSEIEDLLQEDIQALECAAKTLKRDQAEALRDKAAITRKFKNTLRLRYRAFMGPRGVEPKV